ncbi:hypothetical protein AgCh_026059 [Apium graveolens]
MDNWNIFRGLADVVGADVRLVNPQKGRRDIESISIINQSGRVSGGAMWLAAQGHESNPKRTTLNLIPIYRVCRQLAKWSRFTCVTTQVEGDSGSNFTQSSARNTTDSSEGNENDEKVSYGDGLLAAILRENTHQCFKRLQETQSLRGGPHMPTKLSVEVAGQPTKSVPKEKSDYTAEDISSIAKDAKYDIEDSNLKFLLALPERWDLKATIIRDNYNLDETTLDEIYGMLKTHELEMEQRSKRNGRKSRTVAFVAEEESPKVDASRKGKEKALITKSDIESSSSDGDDDSETESIPEMDHDEEMMKLCALMVKGITKIAYRKFRGDYSNVKCYNWGEKGHISPDCRKGKSDKGKALVTKKKSWSDVLDSEDEENYALMENADSSSDTADLKVPQTTYVFHTDDITELRRYLKTIFISYKDQTLIYERLTSENLAYKKRNDYLEKELVMFHQTQKDRDDAFYVRDEVLKMNESLKTELEKEREIIRTWTNSGKTTQDILSSKNWKEGLSYGDGKNSKGTVETEPIFVKQKTKVNPVKFVTAKSDIDKSEVKEKITSDKPKHDKPTEINMGLMTKKQLKHKLKDVKNVNKGNRKNILVLDSGCSGDMTRNKALLSDFVEKAGPGVSYGDGNIGKTLGYGNINLENVIIEKVALVSGLKHNLLSVSQICDRGYHVDFFEEHCEVVSESTCKVFLKGYRHGNIYEAKLSTSTDGSAICLLSRSSIEESWDWHKKLSHLNFNNINELVKKDLVRGLPKSVFAPDGLCDSCQKAKQRKSSFKSKTESSILEP